MRNMKLAGTLAIIGATLCYGLVPSLSFMAFDTGLVSETILFNKFLYAAVIMWFYIFIRRLPFKLLRGQIRPMIVVVLAYAGIAITLYLAFEQISGSLATIIEFTFPAMVITVEMLRGREPVRAVKIFAVILSMIGLCLVVWSPDMEVKMTGVIFALLCAICYVFYTIGLSHPTLKNINSFVTAGYVMATSAVINFFRCLFSDAPVLSQGADQLFFVLVLAIVNAFLAIMLFCLGVKLIGPTNASIINTAEPVCACVFGYLLVGDLITTSMVIGGFLVVVAVLLTNLPDKKGALPDSP